MAFGEENDTSLDNAGYHIAIMVALALSIVFYLIFKSDPPPPPENYWAFGCYSASGAPYTLLDDRGFLVLQEAMEPIPFSLRRGKTGIVLELDATIKATRRGHFYTIQRTSDGGLFVPFFRESNGTIFGVMEVSELNGFRLLMNDGRYLAYQRTSNLTCASAAASEG